MNKWKVTLFENVKKTGKGEKKELQSAKTSCNLAVTYKHITETKGSEAATS